MDCLINRTIKKLASSGMTVENIKNYLKEHYRIVVDVRTIQSRLASPS